MIADLNNIQSEFPVVFLLDIQSPEPLVVKESFELSLFERQYLSRFQFQVHGISQWYTMLT